jgi:hypothetical protein
MVTDEHLTDVASILWVNLYETAFQGKKRGAFTLSREQLITALETKRLDPDLFKRLQSVCLASGLYIADLDGQFPCIGLDEMMGFRQVPKDTFSAFFDREYDLSSRTGGTRRRTWITTELKSLVDDEDVITRSPDNEDD